MKVVHRDQAKKVKLSNVCNVLEYPIQDKDINGAVGKIRGRYPTAGRVVNQKCKEMAYVIKGKGKLVVEGKRVSLRPGTLVLIEPGERYYWQGDFEMFMPCAPAWYPQQYKEVK